MAGFPGLGPPSRVRGVRGQPIVQNRPKKGRKSPKMAKNAENRQILSKQGFLGPPTLGGQNGRKSPKSGVRRGVPRTPPDGPARGGPGGGARGGKFPPGAGAPAPAPAPARPARPGPRGGGAGAPPPGTPRRDPPGQVPDGGAPPWGGALREGPHGPVLAMSDSHPGHDGMHRSLPRSRRNASVIASHDGMHRSLPVTTECIGHCPAMTESVEGMALHWMLTNIAEAGGQFL